MAVIRLPITNYAVLELNRVSFGIKGEVIADLPLKSTFINTVKAENGMILEADYSKGEVRFPSSATAPTGVLGIHYSTEKLYDPMHPGLNEFYLQATSSGVGSSRSQVMYPRLGILSKGDRFTTNCVSFTEATYTDVAGLKAAIAAAATTPQYGIVNTADGSIKIVASHTTETLVMQVVKATTLPNGDYGIKFVVIKS